MYRSIKLPLKNKQYVIAASQIMNYYENRFLECSKKRVSDIDLEAALSFHGIDFSFIRLVFHDDDLRQRHD